MTQQQELLQRAAAFLTSTANEIEVRSDDLADISYQAGLKRAALLTAMRVNAVAHANPYLRTKAAVDQIVAAFAETPYDHFATGLLFAQKRVHEALEVPVDSVSGFLADAHLSIEHEIATCGDYSEIQREYKRGLKTISDLLLIHSEEWEVELARGQALTPAVVAEFPLLESQRQAIDICEKLLAKARKGEILELCAVATLGDAESYYANWTTTANIYGLAGFLMATALRRVDAARAA